MGSTTKLILVAASLGPGLACSSSTRGDDPVLTGGDITAGGDGDGTDGSGGSDGSGSSSDGTSSGGDGGGNTDGGGSDGGGGGDTGDIRFDVGEGDSDGPGNGGEGGDCTGADCNCTGVDILFVVDNSSSMSAHQAAIAAAFPDFANAMFDSLSPGTNLHVGVTTTEFGYESSGQSSNQNGTCSVNGGGEIQNIYVTPDQMDLGKDGAQGKLRTVDGRTYYDIDTDAPQAERDAFTDWFGRAVVAGTTGSNVEMSSGAAAWVGDPANLPHNDGFLRDAGAVYVIIVLQDEFDQTAADGGDLLNMIASQKAACGGLNCVVGGGWLNDSCNDVEGFDNLPKMVAGFSNNFVRPLDRTSTIDGTDLALVLAPIIAEKCSEIPPVG